VKVKELVAALLEGGPERQEWEIILPDGYSIIGAGEDISGTRVQLTKGSFLGRAACAEPGYYVAARDAEGHIRLRSGQGQLVARKEDTIEMVSAWIECSAPGHYRRMYEATLALMLSEQEEKSE